MEETHLNLKITTNLKKINHTVKSMKEQMKITESEKLYRLENFKLNNVKEDYIKCFKCTKCDKSFRSMIENGKELYIHPLLEVLMCFSCCNFYGDGNFSMGSDDEDKYCRWCGEGGIIFSCSKCICGFCNKCIKKHFGEETLRKIEDDDDWKCYFCDPTPLWFLRAICSLAKQISETKKSHKKKKTDYKSLKRKRSKMKINKGCMFSFNNQHEKIYLNAIDSDGESETKEKKKKSDEINIYNPVQELFDENLKTKKQILLKLKGVWEITQLLMEIGLKASGERLNILTNFNTATTIIDFKTEYTKLKIILDTLKLYFGKTTDCIDSLKHDLNFGNADVEECKDEQFEKSFQEKIKAELKKINSIEIVKPVLKVKSFAKMTSDNFLNPQKNDFSIKLQKNEIVDQNNTGKKLNHANFDEYNEETDESSGKKSLTKKQNDIFSQTEISEEDKPYMVIVRSKKKLKRQFESFKQKRIDFIKKTRIKGKFEISKEDKSKSDNKNLMNFDSSDDNCHSKNKKCKNNKLRVIESSSENEDEDEDEEEDENEDKKKKETMKKEKKTLSSLCNLDRQKKRKEESSSFEESDNSLKSTKRSTDKLNYKNKENSDCSNFENEEIEKKVNKITKSERRNVNEIFNSKFLQLDTKKAVKCEEERQERLQKKEKLFEELFLSDTKERETQQLILDFDEKTKKPLVEVHKNLIIKLKPHQIEGVKFMWNNCFESVNRLKKDCGSGCILAHCMGFGKTLQVITLIHTVMSHDLGVNTVLIISPFNIISTWINEFHMWLKDVEPELITIYDLLKIRSNRERAYKIENWKKNGGVMILSYDLFRNLTKSNANSEKKILKLLKKALWNPGPDLVICDEGHLLKNVGSCLYRCLNRIKTARRIILTGTPLQNNLLEYYCMMQFVKPNFLGTKKEFLNYFINPITNGQFEDSKEEDVKLMKQRSHVLHSLLKGCVQRFGFSTLASYLPEKKEFVLLISLTNAQINAYNYFVNTLSSKVANSSKVTTLFNNFHYLQRIWTHPKALIIESNKDYDKKLEQTDSEGSLKDFIVHSDKEESILSSSTDGESSVEEIYYRKKKKFRANNVKLLKDVETEIAPQSENKYWWQEFFLEKDFEDIHSSNKLLVLLFLLNQCSKAGEKILVFSQSLNSLDIIEYFLNKANESYNTDNTYLESFQDSWLLGIDYFRLDDSTSNETRIAWCRSFNLLSNKRARLFLISTKTGGLGINLNGANRVVIFDASWNPSNDLQSIFRVYRFGQKKKCYIYRFLAEGTMEEKIYRRQISKLSLAERVIDEHQIEKHYSVENLQDLYNFEPTPQEKRKTVNLPKDSLLAELLAIYNNVIVAFYEQDSLLENKEEEELSEQEKKAAWENYNEEKQKKNICINFPQNLENISFTHKPSFSKNYVSEARINPFTVQTHLPLNLQ